MADSYRCPLSPLQTGEEKTVWVNQRTRGFVQLCGGEQAHVHGEGEAEGRVTPPHHRPAGAPALSTGVEELNVCRSPSLQMLNRLTKSAEVQTAVDGDYFRVNMEGHQMRLKLENTLKNCHQVGAPPLLPGPLGSTSPDPRSQL